MPRAPQAATSHPQSPESRAWAARKFDVDFLVDSGLLFLLNHEIFHPLGLAMTVKVDGERKSLGLKDSRQEPGKMVFEREVGAALREKHRKFMLEWGLSQLQRRRLELGREIQDLNEKD